MEITLVVRRDKSVRNVICYTALSEQVPSNRRRPRWGRKTHETWFFSPNTIHTG